MKRSRFGAFLRIAGLALVCATAAAAPAFAAPAKIAALRGSDDALSLVPTEAASIAVIRFNELRSSPLAGRLFHDADHLGGNGEAARFMEEANLKPREDVDTAVVVGLLPGSGNTPVLALLEGRFDPDRLTAAATSRGAVRVSTSFGDYFLLPEKESSHSNHGKGAVAFVSPRLVIGGTDSAVATALAARAAGGTKFLSGVGLGRQLSRIDRASSVWALVDVTRYPQVKNGFSRHGNAEHQGSEAGAALFGAMKSVTFFSFQATMHSDDVALVATGVSPDAETRQLLEDSLRGVVAMWRLAVQEKQPDLVAVLRRFKIDSSDDAVTVSGTLPGSVVRSLADKRSASK
jgi:hypothetical protein